MSAGFTAAVQIHDANVALLFLPVAAEEKRQPDHRQYREMRRAGL